MTRSFTWSALGFWLLLLLLCGQAVQGAPERRHRGDGSCRAAGMCCPGRDASCVVRKMMTHASIGVTSGPNALVEERDEQSCYCDHACMQLGDCCDDFKESCGVSDCHMSEWGPWSECDTDCGPGGMGRERTILEQPRNGGLSCGELRQRRGCYGHRCNSKPQDKIHRETALLLPVTFSPVRSMNDSYDIRQNLKYLPKSELSKENNTTAKPYVVLFEVTKSRKACEALESFNLLREGQRLCISCEVTAMRKHLGHRCTGHGLEDRTSRFAALGNLHCHGRWQRLERTDRCPHGRQPDFIFV
ncbi:somatomedin-B and thrombospondin type-1 domain-containing protein-like [Rhipicephalus microplus]|uniref:somatomedin-B and thrombospondin type-1 domain-containing protein-like n=1 Tax=Rhipicephalus microplus TaxID=6941 RepID=UPI003F6C09F6